MSRNETEQIVAQFRRVLARRKRLIAVFVGAALASVVLYNETTTPQYEATTTLVFDEMNGPVPTFVSDASREVLATNRIQELQSRAFAAEIVTALSPDSRARFGTPEGWDEDDYITDVVRANLIAATVRNSSVIRLIVRLPDPELAAAVANAAAWVHEERSLRVRQEGVRAMRTFVEEQLVQYEARLENAEKALRDYKAKVASSSLPDHEQEIVRRLTEAEVLFNQATTERQSLESRLETIEAELKRTREDLVPSVSEASSPRMARLQERLIELEERYADLQLQNYDPNHPQMREIARDVEQTRRDLADEAEKVAQNENLVDPIGQLERYGAERLAVQIQLEELRATEAALRRVIRQYEQTLSSLPEKELQLARLTRERDVNQKVHANLVEELEDTRIAEAGNLPSVRIVDPAVPDYTPIHPRKRVNLMLGLLAGFIGGLTAGFLREATAGAVDSSEELEEHTGWPVLASIPQERRSGDGPQQNLLALNEPNGATSEAFRMLRTNLTFRGLTDRYRSVLVTSAVPNDGKSTVVANLAVSFAMNGRRVLVVDAEVRRAGMHEVFDVPRDPGLSEILLQEARAGADAALSERTTGADGSSGDSLGVTSMRASSRGFPYRLSIHPTRIENLDVLPGGAQLDAPAEVLSANARQLAALLESVRDTYDVVLLDTPPLGLVHDTAVLAGIVDGVLYVVNAQRHDPGALGRCSAVLEGAGATVLGSVLNRVDTSGVYRDNEYYYRHGS